MSREEYMIQNIPVVDLGQLGVGVGDPGKGEWQRVAEELKDALAGVGFVYLTNHGIPRKQIEKLFSNSLRFFNLEEEIKKKYISPTCKEEYQEGYIAIRPEKHDSTSKVPDLRESFFMKHLGGLFPDTEIPELRRVASAFHASCKTLTARLLTAMALALNLKQDFFTSTHRELFIDGDNMSVLSLNYYPTIPPTFPPNSIRCSPHTDHGTITLLFQDEMGGLQVRKDGSWIDVEPIPDTIVVNAGELLQFWTAGKLVATEHQVIIPEEEIEQRTPRQSIAFFIHPDTNTVITPIDGSTSSKPITAREYLVSRIKSAYR